ncbi:polysaccharide deacetylase family protein, partial [Micromonospora sp. NPDC007271]|uniref:polysaccharide deacetylase family protein n=1 Tax=Micromonospora sp. NPDC007271 TaxID=3154587 RepID=UPI0033C367DC
MDSMTATRPRAAFGKAERVLRASRVVRASLVFTVVVMVAGLVAVLGRGLVADSSSRGAGPLSAGVGGLLFADQSPNEVLPPSGKAGDDPWSQSDEVDQGGQPAEASKADGPSGARAITGTSAVALTFDDGPDPRYTPQVLALLREHHLTATFCVVGENARAHPDLIRAIVAGGHTLCNHTWNHDVALGRRSPDRVR